MKKFIVGIAISAGLIVGIMAALPTPVDAQGVQSANPNRLAPVSYANAIYFGSGTYDGIYWPGNKYIYFGNNAYQFAGLINTNGINTSSYISFTAAGSGGIYFTTNGAKPACAVGMRNAIYIVQGGAGVKDTFEVCLKDAGDAYAWRTIY